MRKIKTFKVFESSIPDKSEKFISEDDIREIFIEMFDNYFEVQFYKRIYVNNAKSEGTYFFEFFRHPSKSSMGAINKNTVYGYTNLKEIKENIDVFDILEHAKSRLNSMGYTIGYEFEIDFTNMNNTIKIICHMQHSKLDEIELEEEEDLFIPIRPL